LKSLLSQAQWDKIRKDTYKRFSYRCTVCGCKGQAWPVECDERWHYAENNVQPSYGTVVFFVELQLYVLVVML
jgi:5-methylcytosine-specific restriction endonuclease McrA